MIQCYSHSKHTGGVCVYIKKVIQYSNVSVIQQQNIWYSSLEISIRQKQTVLGGIYLSTNSEHKQNVIDSFKEWFESVSSEKPVAVCGDFNINMLSDTLCSKKLQQICDENGANENR